ncbi:hypothetical protein [Azospirillum sp. sgz302134]
MKMIVKAALFGALLGTAAPPASAQSNPTPSTYLAGVTGELAGLVGATTYVHEKDAAGAVIAPYKDNTLNVAADCSGWVSHNLQKLPVQYQAVHAYQSQVKGEEAMPYPRANVYRQYFANLTADAPFKPIKRLADVQPGDILSWCLPGHCGIPYSGKPADDTGHVMVVVSKPVRNDANSAFLMVLDSSSVTHYSFGTLPAAVQQANPDLGKLYAQYPKVRETNNSDGTVSTSGVGPGLILFGTNPDGSIKSFQFGPKDHVNSDGILFAVGRAVTPAKTVAAK